MMKNNDLLVKEKYDIIEQSKYLLLIADINADEEDIYSKEYSEYTKEKIKALKELLSADTEIDKSTITIMPISAHKLIPYCLNSPNLKPLSVLNALSVYDPSRYFIDVKFIDSNDSLDINLQEYDEVYAFGASVSESIVNIYNKNVKTITSINQQWYIAKQLSFHELDESTVLIYFGD